MLIGSFTKKVLEKRKPRPHELINARPKPVTVAVASATSSGSLKTTPLNTDSAGYIEAYSAPPVKSYTIQLKTGQQNVATEKVPLKGVSERIEEFVTEEDNLGEDTMNPKKMMFTTRESRSPPQNEQVSTMVRDPSEDGMHKVSTLRNLPSMTRPESGRKRVHSAKSQRITPKDSEKERLAIENANNVI